MAGAGPGTTPHPRTGPALVVAAATLWGTSGTAQAFAPEGATPLVVGAIRIVLGGLVLGGFGLWVRALPPIAKWRSLPLAVAVVGMAAYQPLFFSGVARAGVALGTIVGIGSSPVIAGALAFVFLRERPPPAWYVATPLAVAGAALLVAPARDAVGADALGVTLAIAAGAAYAAFVLASKRLMANGWSSDAVAGVTFPLAGALLLPFLAAGPVAWLGTPRGAAVALHLGVITAGVGYILFTRGLARTHASSSVTLTLAEPLTAAALGVLVLGERLTPAGVVGALLLFGALVFLSTRA